MNKTKFLSELKASLADLPRQDRMKALDFYKEMIDDRLDEGLTEEEAVSSIGTPKEIAAQVRPELRAKPRKKISWGVILLLILGLPLWLPLLLTAAVILLTVVIVLYAVELTLSLCGIAGVLGGLVLLVLWKPYAALALLGPGLICLGLAIPCFFLCVLTTRAIWCLTKKTCRSIFRKG